MPTATLSAVLLTHDITYAAAVKDKAQADFEALMGANLAEPSIAEKAVRMQDNPELVTFEAIVALGVKLARMPKAEVLSVAQAIGMVARRAQAKARLAMAIEERIRSIKQSSMRAKLI